MDYKLQDMEKGAVLSLSGDMTIRNGQALREVLFRTIGDKEALFLDLTSAGEVDVSSLQLLCSAHRTSRHLNKDLSLLGELPAALGEAIRQAGFGRVGACAAAGEGHCLLKGGETDE